MRKFILRLLPLGLVEILAPKICSIDSTSDGSTWYRLYDSTKVSGAKVLIRRTNNNKTLIK